MNYSLDTSFCSEASNVRTRNKIKDATKQLTRHMKKQKLLPSASNDDLSRSLKTAFEEAKKSDNDTKNYYSVSLQHFFKNLNDKQREQLCDGFVENWINIEQ